MDGNGHQVDYSIDPAAPACLPACLDSVIESPTADTTAGRYNRYSPIRAAWDRAACNSSRTPITARYDECVPTVPEYLVGLCAGRHLSCHLMSPHRRVKQNRPNFRDGGVSHSQTCAFRTDGRLTAHRNNRRPSDRLPKQRSLTLLLG